MISRSLLFALVLLALSGCAAGQPSASASSSPRTRCLANPNEGGTRPLVFLLCIESP